MIFLVNKGNFSHCIRGNFPNSFEGKNKIQGDVVKLNKFMLLNYYVYRQLVSHVVEYS